MISESCNPPSGGHSIYCFWAGFLLALKCRKNQSKHKAIFVKVNLEMQKFQTLINFMQVEELIDLFDLQEDKSTLSKYKEAVEKRLHILEEQGYVYAYETISN